MFAFRSHRSSTYFTSARSRSCEEGGVAIATIEMGLVLATVDCWLIFALASELLFTLIALNVRDIDAYILEIFFRTASIPHTLP